MVATSLPGRRSQIPPRHHRHVAISGRFSDGPALALRSARSEDTMRPVSPLRRRTALVLTTRIERAILLVRGERVMLDGDLAMLYDVQTRALLQAVKRNANRFPPDFMFQLTAQELSALRSQIVISSASRRHGGRRYLPHAFTEQGIAMLSTVLRSDRAVRVNVEIMRAFVRLRRILASHADLARRLKALEKKYDGQFQVVFRAIRDLMAPLVPDPPRRRIGFRAAGTDSTALTLVRRRPSR